MNKDEQNAGDLRNDFLSRFIFIFAFVAVTCNRYLNIVYFFICTSFTSTLFYFLFHTFVYSYPLTLMSLLLCCIFYRYRLLFNCVLF